MLGSAAAVKRSPADTAKPSQWPEARASFTMRANAAASGTNVHGIVPPTHTSFERPNIFTRSSATNTSGEEVAVKLAKENPFGFTFRPVETSVAVRLTEPDDDDDPPPHDAIKNALKATMAKRREVFIFNSLFVMTRCHWHARTQPLSPYQRSDHRRPMCLHQKKAKVMNRSWTWRLLQPL